MHGFYNTHLHGLSEAPFPCLHKLPIFMKLIIDSIDSDPAGLALDPLCLTSHLGNE